VNSQKEGELGRGGREKGRFADRVERKTTESGWLKQGGALKSQRGVLTIVDSTGKRLMKKMARYSEKREESIVQS